METVCCPEANRYFLVMSWILMAVHFSDTITLGSVILGMFAVAGGLAVFAYGARWKAAYETERITASSLDEGRRAFLERSERLESELKEALVEAVELRQQIHKLEAATDLTEAMGMMHQEHTTILRSIEHLATMLKGMTKEFPLARPENHVEVEASIRRKGKA